MQYAGSFDALGPFQSESSRREDPHHGQWTIPKGHWEWDSTDTLDDDLHDIALSNVRDDNGNRFIILTLWYEREGCHESQYFRLVGKKQQSATAPLDALTADERERLGMGFQADEDSDELQEDEEGSEDSESIKGEEYEDNDEQNVASEVEEYVPEQQVSKKRAHRTSQSPNEPKPFNYHAN